MSTKQEKMNVAKKCAWSVLANYGFTDLTVKLGYPASLPDGKYLMECIDIHLTDDGRKSPSYGCVFGHVSIQLNEENEVVASKYYAKS